MPTSTYVGCQHSVAAYLSVPKALVCALEAVDFEDEIRNAVSIGVDSHTIAGIAGSLAEARFGIPTSVAQNGSPASNITADGGTL